jgi:prepilin-type N-terminal cleavage/methylation domain-containing protein
MPPEEFVVIAIAAFDSAPDAHVCEPPASVWLRRQAQAVRHQRIARRRGVTLLELMVVLALMGLVLAIAAPAFITPRSNPSGGLPDVVATARRAAILRAEPVTLAIDSTGTWEIDGDATRNAPPIATGTLTGSGMALRVRVSPMGTCIPDGPVARSGEWNALDCRLEHPVTEAVRR